MAGIFKQTGLIRLAHIEKVYPETMTVDIAFSNDTTGNSLKPGGRDTYTAQMPISYLSAGGGFIGGLIQPGTPVAVCQAESGHHYYIVSVLARDPAAGSTVGASQIMLPPLDEDTVYLYAHPDTTVTLTQEMVRIGDLDTSFTFDTANDVVTNGFSSNQVLSQGSREITGGIYRDRNNETDSKEIGLDPVANTTLSTYGEVARNPGRTEKRELIFEYENVARVKSNVDELKGYNRQNVAVVPGFQNRRELTNDTFSLSLVYPYHLMETIKGTGVDTYGNVLDINRSKLPLGEGKNSILGIKSTATAQSTNKNIYEQIKRIERRSIAYHFEINARKEVEKSGPPNPAIRDNYARDRSRFFIDIDKEGLLKVNVPASSSTGNIPLLTRYENYSTVSPNPRSKNPNDVSLPPNQVDLLIEGFQNFAPIKIVDESGSTSSPVDRFSSAKSPNYIGHGTAYHNIADTIKHSTIVSFYKPDETDVTTALGSGNIAPIKEVVSKTIITSGPNANAGGRSGSFNFDGSIDVNVGANQIDNQSVWLDTEGGIVGNIGQDKNGMSVAASLDGNVYLQLGDTSSIRGKVFDLKVADGIGNLTVFRVDSSGVSVTTQGRMLCYAEKSLVLRSGSQMLIEAPDMRINGRQVLVNPGAGPFR